MSHIQVGDQITITVPKFFVRYNWDKEEVDTIELPKYADAETVVIAMYMVGIITNQHRILTTSLSEPDPNEPGSYRNLEIEVIYVDQPSGTNPLAGG